MSKSSARGAQELAAMTTTTKRHEIADDGVQRLTQARLGADAAVFAEL